MTRWRVASSMGLVCATTVALVAAPPGTPVASAAGQVVPITRVSGPAYGDVVVEDIGSSGNAVLLIQYPGAVGKVYDRVSGKRRTLSLGAATTLSGDGKVAFGLPEDDGGPEREVVGSGTVTTVTSAVPNANWRTFQIDASATGRYVAVGAVEPVTGRHDVFVVDTVTSTRSQPGLLESVPALYDNSSPSISADGRYVAYVASVIGQPSQIWVYDRLTNTRERASANSSAVAGNGPAAFPAISGNGRHVVFLSASTNLVSSTTTAAARYYVRNLDTDTTRLIPGTVLPGTPTPSISTDGSRIAYVRGASTQPANGGATFVARQLFIDTNGTRVRVTVDTTGKAPNGQVFSMAMSANGRRIAFLDSATDLTAAHKSGVFIASPPAL